MLSFMTTTATITITTAAAISSRCYRRHAPASVRPPPPTSPSSKRLLSSLLLVTCLFAAASAEMIEMPNCHAGTTRAEFQQFYEAAAIDVPDITVVATTTEKGSAEQKSILRERAATIERNGEEYRVIDNINREPMTIRSTHFQDDQIELPPNQKNITIAVTCDDVPRYMTCELFAELARAAFSYGIAWINALDRNEAVDRVRLYQWSDRDVKELLARGQLLPEYVVHVRFRDFTKPARNLHSNDSADEYPANTRRRLLGLAFYNFLQLSSTSKMHLNALERDMAELIDHSDQQFQREVRVKNRATIARRPTYCSYNFMAVLMHETLHVLGLSHSTHQRAVMYPTSPPHPFELPPNREFAGIPSIRQEYYALRYFWRRSNQYTTAEHQRQTFWKGYEELQAKRVSGPINGAGTGDVSAAETTTEPSVDPFDPFTVATTTRIVDDLRFDDTDHQNTTGDGSLVRNLAKIDPFDASVRQEIFGRIRERLLSKRRGLVDLFGRRMREKLYAATLVGKDVETHPWVDSLLAAPRDNNGGELSKNYQDLAGVVDVQN